MLLQLVKYLKALVIINITMMIAILITLGVFTRYYPDTIEQFVSTEHFG